MAPALVPRVVSYHLWMVFETPHWQAVTAYYLTAQNHVGHARARGIEGAYDIRLRPTSSSFFTATVPNA